MEGLVSVLVIMGVIVFVFLWANWKYREAKAAVEAKKKAKAEEDARKAKAEEDARKAKAEEDARCLTSALMGPNRVIC